MIDMYDCPHQMTINKYTHMQQCLASRRLETVAATSLRMVHVLIQKVASCQCCAGALLQDVEMKVLRWLHAEEATGVQYLEVITTVYAVTCTVNSLCKDTRCKDNQS